MPALLVLGRSSSPPQGMAFSPPQERNVVAYSLVTPFLLLSLVVVFHLKTKLFIVPIGWMPGNDNAPLGVMALPLFPGDSV